MKKLLTIVLVAGVIMSAQAQKVGFWFDAGLKGGFGPTFMLNNNILDDDTYDHVFSNGYTVGAKFGIFKGLYNGITFDVMYNTGIQKFRDESGDRMIDQEVSWNSTDLAVLYRLQKEGIYVELGPMFSFMNKVDDVYDGNETDVTDFYAEQMTSGVFGFGGYLLGGGQFTLMFGLRATYGFTDMISDDGQNSSYPINPASTHAGFDSYESTNPISVQLLFEANFGLGYFAKTSCSKRMAFFRFD